MNNNNVPKTTLCANSSPPSILKTSLLFCFTSTTSNMAFLFVSTRANSTSLQYKLPESKIMPRDIGSLRSSLARFLSGSIPSLRQSTTSWQN